MMSELYYKHRAFAEIYISTGPFRFNATKAYQEVYNVDEKSATASASRLLRNVNVQAYIEKRIKELQMSADEAILLVTDIARGDIGDFVNDFGMIDISQARKEGKTKLIKRWRSKTITINGKQEDREIHTEDIELYSADLAQDRIIRVHGRYKDVGSEDNPLTVKGLEEMLRKVYGGGDHD